MLPRSRRGQMAAVLAAALVAGGAFLAVRCTVDPPSPITFDSGTFLSTQQVHPGQPESFAAILTSHPDGYSYHITRGSLIPLPGFRTPRLLGAVLLRIRGVPLQAPGFPPRQRNGSRYPVHALSGYRARSGAPPFKPQMVLMYGLRGTQPGGYAVAGVRITYLVGSHSYTTDIYNGALLFCYPRHQTRAQHRLEEAAYNRMNNKAATALQRLVNA
jgi:hypothetical protein